MGEFIKIYPKESISLLLMGMALGMATLRLILYTLPKSINKPYEICVDCPWRKRAIANEWEHKEDMN